MLEGNGVQGEVLTADNSGFNTFHGADTMGWVNDHITLVKFLFLAHSLLTLTLLVGRGTGLTHPHDQLLNPKTFFTRPAHYGALSGYE